MKNKTALEIMTNYLESEGIHISESEASAAIAKWNRRIPNLDSLSLAAIAISDPTENALTKAEIREIREFYFPSKNFIERNLY